MNSQPTTSATVRHAGPHLGILAIVYTALFNAGLAAVSAFGIPFGVRRPWWRGPWSRQMSSFRTSIHMLRIR